MTPDLVLYASVNHMRTPNNQAIHGCMVLSVFAPDSLQPGDGAGWGAQMAVVFGGGVGLHR